MSSANRVSTGPKSLGCKRASARLSICSKRSRQVMSSHGEWATAVSAVLSPSPMDSST
ncbi:Uncharacterised protein [Mycobacteroides abscessus subsp. abscessus]|nr:Uncharacterised protein [Mycobacteroides abscessus subsp. abscessus]SKV01987.1 Uncharacterised protein [Mycobacteroides abscessus subsp. abscessus]